MTLVTKLASERRPTRLAGRCAHARDPAVRNVLQERHVVAAVMHAHVPQGFSAAFVLKPEQQPRGLPPIRFGGGRRSCTGADPGLYSLKIIAGLEKHWCRRGRVGRLATIRIACTFDQGERIWEFIDSRLNARSRWWRIAPRRRSWKPKDRPGWLSSTRQQHAEMAVDTTGLGRANSGQHAPPATADRDPLSQIAKGRHACCEELCGRDVVEPAGDCICGSRLLGCEVFQMSKEFNLARAQALATRCLPVWGVSLRVHLGNFRFRPAVQFALADEFVKCRPLVLVLYADG